MILLLLQYNQPMLYYKLNFYISILRNNETIILCFPKKKIYLEGMVALPI